MVVLMSLETKVKQIPSRKYIHTHTPIFQGGLKGNNKDNVTTTHLLVPPLTHPKISHFEATRASIRRFEAEAARRLRLSVSRGMRNSARPSTGWRRFEFAKSPEKLNGSSLAQSELTRNILFVFAWPFVVKVPKFDQFISRSFGQVSLCGRDAKACNDSSFPGFGNEPILGIPE